MRYGTSLAVVGILVVTRGLSAQELLPATQPNPDAAAPAPSSSIPNSPLPPPAPGPIYPALGPYPPPGLAPTPGPIFGGDPVGNPTFWVGVDGLVWWSKSPSLSVPLVTTGPAAQGASAGNLGMPGTTSLNGPLQYGAQAGFRLFAGGWFDIDHTIGIDGGFFILGQQSTGFSVADRSGAGNLVLNEPLTGSPPFVTQVSAPGLETGQVSVTDTMRFGGGDINLMYNLVRAQGWTVNLLGGYRFIEVDETLAITANSYLFTATQYLDNAGNILANAPSGSTVTVIDTFGTRNSFNGGQLGTSFQYVMGRWSIDGAAKLGIGSTHEVITINGATNVFPVNSAAVQLGGGNFATLQVGRYSMDRFALAPQAQVNLGYQLTPLIRAQLGYSFLYLSSVARPGQQIDNSFDGNVHPLVPMATTSFWSQGLNVGLQFRF